MYWSSDVCSSDLASWYPGPRPTRSRAARRSRTWASKAQAPRLRTPGAAPFGAPLLFPVAEAPRLGSRPATTCNRRRQAPSMTPHLAGAGHGTDQPAVGHRRDDLDDRRAHSVARLRSEEHTSELQSLMRNSYA